MTLKITVLPLAKVLENGYVTTNIAPERFNLFKTELAKVLKKLQSLAGKKGTNDQESEEHYKTLFTEFLKDIGYKSDYYINTKNRIDLAIYNGNDSDSPLAVLFELKSPTNRAEMITADNLNKKALQELVYYYLQERITQGNLAVKHLIITNGHEWFLFDSQEFERIFVKNTALKKQFENFEAGKLSITRTEDFYKEIVAPFIENLDDEIESVHFNLDDYKASEDESALIDLYKILSPEHLLKISVKNDSNTLNKKFYNELLYILGLTETGNLKKTIERCPTGTRQSGALIEEAIAQLKSKDKIRRLYDPSQYGNTEEEQLFNISLELVISWVNRILFLKLLEAQLISYHRGDESYSFLTHKTIKSYGNLDDLFFQVLAKRPGERDREIKEKFAKVPYLNSTLFEPTELEHDTLFVDNLNNKPLPFFSQTVLTEEKKRTGKTDSLEYLLKFLDSYDFCSKYQGKELINASVLGLIFEKINGYKDGSHFTPGFITQYMCRESIRPAVVQKFNEVKKWKCTEFKELYNKINNIKEANEIVNSLKICDPAVGSGHFLVSALNEIIAIKHELRILCDREGNRLKEYKIKVVDDELQITDKGKPFSYHPKDEESRRVQEALFHEKQTIIENCLFGVDINPNSVAICRLRLWIELLKNAYYKNDTELETIPNIDINIKCGNSLVSRFPLTDSMEEILKNSKHTIKSYRTAIADYRNAKSKSDKQKMEDLIVAIKKEFRGHFQRRFDFENANESEETTNNSIYRNAFEWRLEFPEVLDDKGNFIGFDIVIGNPPYKQLAASQIHLPHYKSKYQVAHGGKVNLYRLFFECGISLLKKHGNFAYITPDTYFSSKSNFELRKFLVNNVRIEHITHYRESDNVFENVTQAVAILLARRSDGKGVFTLQRSDSETSIDTNALSEQDGFLFCADNCVMQRMKKAKYRFRDVCDGYQGEVNVSTKKDFITTMQTPGSLPLVRGDHISNYFFSGSSEWCVPESTPRKHFKNTRIVFQEVVNMQVKKRINGVLLTDCYCGHTTNYFIEKTNGYNLKIILGVLNSQAINFFFKSINQTNHVPIGEILAVPFPEIDDKNTRNKIIKLVDRILAAKSANPTADTSELEREIDRLVYALYGLTADEIGIIEGGK